MSPVLCLGLVPWRANPCHTIDVHGSNTRASMPASSCSRTWRSSTNSHPPAGPSSSHPHTRQVYPRTPTQHRHRHLCLPSEIFQASLLPLWVATHAPSASFGLDSWSIPSTFFLAPSPCQTHRCHTDAMPSLPPVPSLLAHCSPCGWRAGLVPPPPPRPAPSFPPPVGSENVWGEASPGGVTEQNTS